MALEQIPGLEAPILYRGVCCEQLGPVRLGNCQQWLNRGSCLVPELGPRVHQEVRLWLDLVVRRQGGQMLDEV